MSLTVYVEEMLQTVLGEASRTLKAVLKSAKARARVAVGITADTDLDARVLFDIMDHYIQQHGKTETRDVFVYREGFYQHGHAAYLETPTQKIVFEEVPDDEKRWLHHGRMRRWLGQQALYEGRDRIKTQANNRRHHT